MIERLKASDLRRLKSNSLIDLAEIREAGTNHAKSLDRVRAALGSHKVRERLIEEVRLNDADDVDLVITVGGDDGTFRIVRGVAPDRVISTVDPQARHGHKTAS
jgi:hypothetical protein